MAASSLVGSRPRASWNSAAASGECPLPSSMRPRQTWPAAPALPSLTASLQALCAGDPLLLFGVGILEPGAFAEDGFGHAEVGIEFQRLASHQDCVVDVLGLPAVIEEVALRLEVVLVGGGVVGAVVFQGGFLFRAQLQAQGFDRSFSDILFDRKSVGQRNGDGITVPPYERQFGRSKNPGKSSLIRLPTEARKWGRGRDWRRTCGRRQGAWRCSCLAGYAWNHFEAAVLSEFAQLAGEVFDRDPRRGR